MNVLSKAYITFNGNIFVAYDPHKDSFGVSFSKKEAINHAIEGKQYAELRYPSWLMPTASNVKERKEEEKAYVVYGASPLLKKFLPYGLIEEKEIVVLTNIDGEVTIIAMSKTSMFEPPIVVTSNNVQNCLFQLIVEHDRSMVAPVEVDILQNKRNQWLFKYICKLPKCDLGEIIK